MTWKKNQDIIGIILLHSHPLDAGNFQFVSKLILKQVQAHTYWRLRFGFEGSVKRRKINDYVRYKRLVSAKRVCYACFQRKITSRSRRRTNCEYCSYKEVMQHIYNRGLYKSQRYFQKKYNQSYCQILAQDYPIKKMQFFEFSRKITPPSRMKMFGVTSIFHDYTTSASKVIIFNHLVQAASTKKYRKNLKKMTGVQELQLFAQYLNFTPERGDVYLQDWGKEVSKKILQNFFRKLDILKVKKIECQKKILVQEILPIVRKLTPVYDHYKLSSYIFNFFRSRLRNRKDGDIAFCQKTENHLLYNRIVEISATDYSSYESPLARIWVYLEPICLALHNFIRELVPEDYIRLQTNDLYHFIRHNIILYIFKINLRQNPMNYIYDNWGIL